MSLSVGDFGHGDTSIQIMGLKSAHFYSIRVIATNAANFSTLGPLIRLRTKSSQLANPSSILASDEEIVESDSYDGEPASVRTSPSHFDASISGTHHVFRESGGNNGRKSIPGRNSSPLTQNNENMAARVFCSGSDDEHETDEAIQQLTQRLENVRREHQEIDKQIHEEEQESRLTMNKLIKDRDQLKHLLKDKEDLSSDLRKHGNQLDKLNRNAQSRKAAKEKILTQKRAERQKMEDEIIRWDKERLDMREKVDEMLDEKASFVAAKNAEVSEVRERIAHDQVLIKSLEEDLHVKGIQIKEMEREKAKPFVMANSEQENGIPLKESENAWEAKFQATQVQLATLWQALQQVCPFISVISSIGSNEMLGSGREPKGSRTSSVVDF